MNLYTWPLTGLIVRTLGTWLNLNEPIYMTAHFAGLVQALGTWLNLNEPEGEKECFLIHKQIDDSLAYRETFLFVSRDMNLYFHCKSVCYFLLVYMFVKMKIFYLTKNLRYFLIHTSWHSIIEGGEASRYPWHFTPIPMENLNYYVKENSASSYF